MGRRIDHPWATRGCSVSASAAVAVSGAPAAQAPRMQRAATIASRDAAERV
ncbi:hypothetical protein [Streptomyces sp. Ag109_O5-1]|uniref:hypothetical protein n=1 Tax=Streptomyces sp. Ag109_O5-1 TaxID=1938851 RepID=UPI00162ACDCF|nr:hypothetical protein [Streptomyces sp. Ag109_O5-1]